MTVVKNYVAHDPRFFRHIGDLSRFGIIKTKRLFAIYGFLRGYRLFQGFVMHSVRGANIYDVYIVAADQLVLGGGGCIEAVFLRDSLGSLGGGGANAADRRGEGQIAVKIFKIIYTVGVNLAHRAKAQKSYTYILFHRHLPQIIFENNYSLYYTTYLTFFQEQFNIKIIL